MTSIRGHLFTQIRVFKKLLESNWGQECLTNSSITQTQLVKSALPTAQSPKHKLFFCLDSDLAVDFNTSLCSNNSEVQWSCVELCLCIHYFHQSITFKTPDIIEFGNSPKKKLVKRAILKINKSSSHTFETTLLPIHDHIIKAIGHHQVT